MPTTRSRRTREKASNQQPTEDDGERNTTTEQPTGSVRRRGRPPGTKHKTLKTYFGSAPVETDNADTGKPKGGSVRSTTAKSKKAKPAAPEAVAGKAPKTSAPRMPTGTSPRRSKTVALRGSKAATAPANEPATTGDAEPAAPRKRGRPLGRKNTPKPESSSASKPAPPRISKTTAQQHTPKSVDPPIPDPETPHKRGRPRKDAAKQQAATPRKRGYQKKTRTKAAAKRRAAETNDSASDYENELSTHESDMQLEADDYVLLSELPPRKKERKTANALKVRPAEMGADDYTLLAASPPGKKGRPSASAFKRQRAQMEVLWMGPSASGSAEHVNPNYIDAGLELHTWSWLRSVRVDPDAVTIEPCSSAIGRSQGGAEPENLSVSATMAGADHPQNMRPLDVHRLAGPTPGWAVNTGEHVAALDWAPVAPPGNATDYLASAGMGPTPAGGLGTLLARRERTPAQPGSVCLWRIATAASSPTCQLDMQLSHTFGHCLALQWCPVGIKPDSATPGAAVVGVLAAAFGDGVLRVLPVPEPDSLRQHQATSSLPANEGGGLSTQPVRMRWPEVSLAELRPLKGVVTALAWAASDILVAGTSRGALMVWELSGVVRAQQHKHYGHPWPYTQLSDSCATPQKPNPAPIICQQLHNGPIFTVSTYIGGSSAAIPFAHGRDEQGFRRVSPTDVQIITLGADGRLRQTLLALPTRHCVPLANIVRSTTIGCAYWPLGTCLFVEKNLRMLNNMLESSDDPWLSRDSSSASATGARGWNQLSDRNSHHLLQMECPLINIGVSDMHAYLALARSDGTLVLTNLLPAGLRGTILNSRVIYRVLSKDSGELVWLPREPAQPRPLGVIKTATTLYNLFPPEIAVITAVWSRNPISAHWIASTSASGILRIEDVSR
ncbi:hypothetical protein H4R20_000547 [Coemansia guatemalensis]|uniref:WD40 repeat-like protein n=1 Tax=Coemansia guatemalensis TaxID=2761395 RepID=A0A9W8HYY8_9FUNG|nr:hypothetical protein H4R20_000547 [Coemansia guatemalensis]